MLTSYLKDKEELINQQLNLYLGTSLELNKKIYEAMNYSLMAGGKRLRPILMLLSNKLVGGEEEKVYPFAVAMEMIHTYSLIHDDLPSMDDDNYRRGKLTNHKVYGEALAILAGDGLLNLAYEIMIKAAIEQSTTNSLNAAYTIAKAAGVSGMIGGQVVDILSEDKEVDEETIDFIHLHKTSKLIEGSLVAGALLGGANEEDIDKLGQIGRNIGLAFQIQDDLLDLEGNPTLLGKEINQDGKTHKATYVSFHGLQKSREKIEALTEESIKDLDGFNNEASKLLKDLIIYLSHRKY